MRDYNLNNVELISNSGHDLLRFFYAAILVQQVFDWFGQCNMICNSYREFHIPIGLRRELWGSKLRINDLRDILDTWNKNMLNLHNWHESNSERPG